MKIVIRAGGIGSRLWPMSRINNPKQFQEVVGDKTMIRTTFERVQSLLKSKKDLFVSVNQNFKERLKEEIPEIDPQNIIVETDTRNTGPAMCLEVCYLEKFCDSSEVIATLPADDYISDSQAFCKLLLSTEKFIKKNPDYILTPAILPNYLDTGYTYFKAGEILEKQGQEAIYSVADVVQKPNAEYCQELINSGIYYCHTGMYLWQLGHIVSLFKKYQPEMYKVCTKIVEMSGRDDEETKKEIFNLYSNIEKSSIESAITEHEEKIAMSVSNHIGWSDLGKWHVIKKVLETEERENLKKGNVITRNSENNLIYSNVPKKVVVVNDVNDLAIIDTGDALYISSLKDSAEVKTIVKKLKEAGKMEYL